MSSTNNDETLVNALKRIDELEEILEYIVDDYECLLGIASVDSNQLLVKKAVIKSAREMLEKSK